MGMVRNQSGAHSWARQRVIVSPEVATTRSGLEVRGGEPDGHGEVGAGGVDERRQPGRNSTTVSNAGPRSAKRPRTGGSGHQ